MTITVEIKVDKWAYDNSWEMRYTVLKWLHDHCDAGSGERTWSMSIDYHRSPPLKLLTVWHFKNEQDATMFALRWA